MSELPKAFDPGAIETRWYAHWESHGLFRPERGDATPWTIVMPPPNVTGSLHIGHALDNTLQDILTRHARMQGKDALWVVGTDHAGIATQMVVERNLDSQGVKRADIGREAFLEHVWEWKAQSGGAITRQLRRLGASCDWSNERFTMDDAYRSAVTHTFVELHKRGLIYRDKRLVNWDPRFQTAISDLEVETKEQQGKFWHLSYPLEDGSGSISVATTRPETMLADMAVAVHPDDERYAQLVGKQVRLPITGRLIPIITDEHADPELGSGAVKITPGHDFNDFEVGKRAGIEARAMLNMLDAQGNIVQTADGLVPEALLGLERFEARKRVVELLESEGALISVEDRVIATPFGDRSGVVIEPWLTDQWYVDAKTLAEPAIAAVRDGTIRVVPETWKKTWYNWLENIQPWCVSRQLWWGHRIPAFYGDDGEVFVAATEEQAREQAGGKPLRQDDDVLDTWFSSALWPFATLGWPKQTEELKRHYPNDVLISGFDILFFWDARMAMQGFELMGEAPWKTLYLHGLVRDDKGQKMSKSKGNVVDPLGLINKYGADALRFTLAAMESQGRDIKLDEKRVEGYRNFATKLWNAARFLQMNGVGASDSIAAPDAALPVNRWIIGEVVDTLAKLDRAFTELRFDDMADAIYHFTWGTFCDWYVELVKGQFDDETKRVAAWAFDQILVMLHPLMPFITEELWAAMGERPYELILARWPAPEASIDPQAKAEMDWAIDLVSQIRSARTELNVPPSAKLHLFTGNPPQDVVDRLDRQHAMLSRLARLDSIQLSAFDGKGAAQLLAGGTSYALPLEGVIDLAAEKARLAKAAEAAEKERDSLAARLGNANFVERAKPEAVEKARADHAEKAGDAERYRAALERLG
ncbi:valine--tRNA ligase [Sphingomonas sabuli]|uniref:Valine--tRNA ligase n=1 Tax=Sphingomonas sabuli TaxID=2764186 RepID=A0A7G9L1Z0_9SPHN|nr:valine--tRNA ligase [Sphingomonas sabuli]QNM82639.1 valine--tRNA ligase [Sphingomonas sabuli]